jgi:hypothetical protein
LLLAAANNAALASSQPVPQAPTGNAIPVTADNFMPLVPSVQKGMARVSDFCSTKPAPVPTEAAGDSDLQQAATAAAG